MYYIAKEMRRKQYQRRFVKVSDLFEVELLYESCPCTNLMEKTTFVCDFFVSIEDFLQE